MGAKISITYYFTHLLAWNVKIRFLKENLITNIIKEICSTIFF